MPEEREYNGRGSQCPNSQCTGMSTCLKARAGVILVVFLIRQCDVNVRMSRPSNVQTPCKDQDDSVMGQWLWWVEIYDDRHQVGDPLITRPAPCRLYCGELGRLFRGDRP
jgi:hypothetical protein